MVNLIEVVRYLIRKFLLGNEFLLKKYLGESGALSEGGCLGFILGIVCSLVIVISIISGDVLSSLPILNKILLSIIGAWIGFYLPIFMAYLLSALIVAPFWFLSVAGGRYTILLFQREGRKPKTE